MQQRREDEAQRITQSVREIYRKLASTLHPDREPEPALREAKTALMQKVNQAYAGNDLLTLLELQLQIEQVDVRHFAEASSERLKHYNRVLADQLDQIKEELFYMEQAFRLDFGVPDMLKVSPGKLGELLKQNERALRTRLAQLQREMSFLDDRAAAKRWLKYQRQMLLEERGDFDRY